MDIVNILSFFLFLVFLTSYILKLFILYKKNGIRANVLAKGGKSQEIGRVELFVKTITFIWGLLWFAFSIMGSKLDKIIVPVIKVDVLRYIGIITLAVGVTIFIVAMNYMKTSWRVGIDKKSETSLITSGVYKYSRNPAFVGFDAMFIGCTLTFPNLLTLIVAILSILAIHRLILQEEKHLMYTFGDKYVKFTYKTPRYILLK